MLNYKEEMLDGCINHNIPIEAENVDFVITKIRGQISEFKKLHAEYLKSLDQTDYQHNSNALLGLMKQTEHLEFKYFTEDFQVSTLEEWFENNKILIE